MRFSFGDVLALLDKTVLNPALAALVPLYLHLATTNKFVIVPKPDSLIKYGLQRPLPRALYTALIPVVLGIVIRSNRYLSRRARNNGVKATFTPEKEIVVVTGGAGGIGGNAVERFAKLGCQVVVLDVMELTYPKASNVHFYKCDLMNYDAVLETAQKIRKDVGAPTAVVANAGICRGKALLEASKRDIEVTFGVNCLAVIWVAKAFLPSMAKANHGHFLITASQGAYGSAAKIVDYSATKAAALSLYEGIQTEMKHLHKAPAVRISCFCPTTIKTKMFETAKTPDNFFFPALYPDDAGKAIVDIVTSAESQHILLPASAYVAIPGRVQPDWMRIAGADMAANIMDELKPHDPLAEKE